MKVDSIKWSPIPLAVLACFAFGCVSQSVFEESLNRSRDLEAQLTTTQSLLDDARADTAIIRSLQERVARLERELRRAQQRAGSIPYTPTELKIAAAEDRIEWIQPTLVTSPTDRGRRQSLQRSVEKSGVAVIAYWATWCVPCTSPEELSHLRALRQDLERAGLGFVTMPIDSLKDVLNDPRAHTWLYPLWHAQDGHINMLPRRMIQSVGVNLPLFIVIDGAGYMRYYHNRRLTDLVVEELVTAAMSSR